MIAALALAGCGSSGHRPAPTHKQVDRPKPITRIACPPHAPAGCRSAVGRVLYVEAVDPDGDGGAHFVLASEDGISAPGITGIDVEKELRPRRLPRVGDAVAAAGPVYRGSYGQR